MHDIWEWLDHLKFPLVYYKWNNMHEEWSIAGLNDIMWWNWISYCEN